ncbi:MAG TPA: RNA polymerase sigma factor [Ktedonobacteraceae bacterium]|nr:RNA polymerase sigma factor [Ktedonobacteraceae bacterium]HEV2662708.1 RNA polymerase sigma factor [Ktedonobacteraceae bacterium]
MSREATDENPENTDLKSGADNKQDSSDGARQAELVRWCLTGDEQAFAVIIDHYGGLLLRTAYLLVRDEEAAKDIVQESFILAWKNMGKLHEPAFLRAWLIKIVVNQSISWQRQLARRAALLREQFIEQYVRTTIRVSEIQGGRLEEGIDLEQAIGQLPLKQRAVLVLFYYYRMTMPEIATLLGVAENTLHKRLQAALEKIRRLLQVDLVREASTAQNGMHPGIGNIRRGGAR